MKKFRIVTDTVIIVSKQKYATTKQVFKLPLYTRFMIGASESIVFKNSVLKKIRSKIHDFIQILFDIKALTFMTPCEVRIEFKSPNELIRDALE